MTTSSKSQYSCGIVIYRKIKKEYEVLLANRKDRDFWEIPKGGPMDEEDYKETARREVMEEVGININKMRLLNKINKNCKTFYFFVAEKNKNPDVSKVNEKGVQEFHKAKYVPIKKAMNKIALWQKPCLEELVSMLKKNEKLQ